MGFWHEKMAERVPEEEKEDHYKFAGASYLCAAEHFSDDDELRACMYTITFGVLGAF